MSVQKKILVVNIEQAKKNLAKLSKKDHPSISVGDALEELKPFIQEAIDKNYTRDNVLQILAQCGIEIKPYRLKGLFGEKLRNNDEHKNAP